MLMTGVRGHALMLMCAANNAGGDEPSNDRIATFVGCVTESPSQSSSSDAANTVGSTDSISPCALAPSIATDLCVPPATLSAVAPEAVAIAAVKVRADLIGPI